MCQMDYLTELENPCKILSYRFFIEPYSLSMFDISLSYPFAKFPILCQGIEQLILKLRALLEIASNYGSLYCNQ